MSTQKIREVEKLVQSYVYRNNGDCFFVSTGYRSTIEALGEVWYFETFAWEWNRETKDRGELIADNSGAKTETAAFDQHFSLANELHDTGKFENE